MPPNNVFVIDRPHIQQWSHKILMNYKQKVCLPCWNKRLYPIKMLNLLLTLGSLNRRGGSVCCPLTLVCLRLGLGLTSIGEEGSLEPTHAHTYTHTLTHSRAHTPSVSLYLSLVFQSCFSVSLCYSFTLSSPFPSSFPFIISPLKLYLPGPLDLCPSFLSSS